MMTRTALLTDWTSLPAARARHDQGHADRQWSRRRDDWSALPKTGLLITVSPLTPVIESEPGIVHLDSLLSYAALTTHPVETLHQPDGTPSILPLPLGLAWIGPQSQPLWCCTPLRVIGPTAESREYWHKRHPADRADWAEKPSVNTRAGRWKEYRTPVRGQLPPRYAAAAIGHREQVQHLLDACCTHIGKKASMGFGRVGRWTVTEIDIGPDAILAQRVTPIAYHAGRQPPTGSIISPCRAWTPPYWYAPWWADCIAPASADAMDN